MKTGAPLLISSIANDYWVPLPATSETKPVRLLTLSAPHESGSAEEVLLQNILKACGLPAEKMTQQTFLPAEVPLWRELRAAHKPEVILLFGITPQQLGVQAQLPVILPQNFDGAVWVIAPALPVLQEDRNLRQLLWTEGLKPCFVS